MGVLVRFLIRFRIQQQRPNVDDGFLTVTLVLFLISIGFMHAEIIDQMYSLDLSLQRDDEVPYYAFLEA